MEPSYYEVTPKPQFSSSKVNALHLLLLALARRGIEISGFVQEGPNFELVVILDPLRSKIQVHPTSTYGLIKNDSLIRHQKLHDLDLSLLRSAVQARPAIIRSHINVRPIRTQQQLHDLDVSLNHLHPPD